MDEFARAFDKLHIYRFQREIFTCKRISITQKTASILQNTFFLQKFSGNINTIIMFYIKPEITRN